MKVAIVEIKRAVVHKCLIGFVHRHLTASRAHMECRNGNISALISTFNCTHIFSIPSWNCYKSHAFIWVFSSWIQTQPVCKYSDILWAWSLLNSLLIPCCFCAERIAASLSDDNYLIISDDGEQTGDRLLCREISIILFLFWLHLSIRAPNVPRLQSFQRDTCVRTLPSQDLWFSFQGWIYIFYLIFHAELRLRSTVI